MLNQPAQRYGRGIAADDRTVEHEHPLSLAAKPCCPSGLPLHSRLRYLMEGDVLHHPAVRGRGRLIWLASLAGLALGASPALASDPPQVERAPTITGTPSEGSVLTAAHGVWSPPGATAWYD